MRQVIRDFVSIVANTVPIMEPIYEFGSFQVPGQEEIANLRPLFPRKEYVGTDMREGPGVDMVLNLHDVLLPSGSVGTVICMDTLEHVEYPNKALEEIHRILMPNGIAIVSNVMLWPIHDHPNDYWRFTPEAFRSILKPFNFSFVGYAGEEIFPHTVVGIGFKGNMPELSEFNRKYEEWQKQNLFQIIGKNWHQQLLPPRDNEESQERHQAPVISEEKSEQQPTSTKRMTFKQIVKLLTPPLLLPIISRVYRLMKRSN